MIYRIMHLRANERLMSGRILKGGDVNVKVSKKNNKVIFF
jgi:hypothetical protein